MEGKQLNYEMLKSIQDYGSPVGATTLYTLFGSKWNLSQASIGRKLLELDYGGYTILQGRKGRIVTGKGRKYFLQLEHELKSQDRLATLLTELGKNEKVSLIDALEARKVIESFMAGRAAVRITDEDIQNLRQILKRQKASVDSSNFNDDIDREFHLYISSVGGNKVLDLCLRWLYEAVPFMETTSYIRSCVGSALVVDHQKILDCLIAHDAQAASEAIGQHIEQVLQDVRKFKSE